MQCQMENESSDEKNVTHHHEMSRKSHSPLSSIRPSMVKMAEIIENILLQKLTLYIHNLAP